jgi:hypothetical protein
MRAGFLGSEDLYPHSAGYFGPAARRRSREVSEGRVHPVAWEDARTQILNEMRQRRASRPTP